MRQDHKQMTEVIYSKSSLFAAHHSDDLYHELEESCKTMLDLLNGEDDKTQSNAAGAIYNFVRNSKQLFSPLVEAGAMEVNHKVLRILLTLGILAKFKAKRFHGP